MAHVCSYDFIKPCVPVLVAVVILFVVRWNHNPEAMAFIV